MRSASSGNVSIVAALVRVEAEVVWVFRDHTLLVIFNIGVMYANSAVAGQIAANTTGSEHLRHSLLSWLANMVYIFTPLASIILFINLLLRRYWSGVVLVIAIGIVTFIGTGIYLVVTGVFFGK